MSLRLLLFLLYIGFCELVQHQIVITNLVSVASPDFGNVSFTVVDSKLSLTAFNKHRIERAIIKIELNLQTSEYEPFTNYMTRSVDLCEAIANPKYEILMYVGYKSIVLDKRNHMFSKCPIKSVRINFYLEIKLLILKNILTVG